MTTKSKPEVTENSYTESELPSGQNRLPKETDADTGAPNPFDVDRIRLAQVDPTAAGVEEKRYDVKYRKPPSDAFFRVHPDPAYSLVIGTLELSGRDESFFVAMPLWAALAGEKHFSYRQLRTCVTVAGDVFLWGLRIPDADKKEQPWVKIPWFAADDAMSQWVRLYWDETQRKHRVRIAKAQHSEPQWPKEPLGDLLQLAFSDALITTLDHPALKRLRGES